MSNTHLQKHTLNLRRGDWDYIESVFDPRGISTSLVIRTLISNFVDTKKREQADDETSPDFDGDL